MLTGGPRFIDVGGRHGVVVECHAVENANEEQRPMCATFGFGHAHAIVDGEEDVCSLIERGQGRLEFQRLIRSQQHEGHAGAQKHNVGLGILFQLFALEVFFPKCNSIVSEPVVTYAIHIQVGEADVVIGEVGIVWVELGEVRVSFVLARLRAKCAGVLHERAKVHEARRGDAHFRTRNGLRRDGSLTDSPKCLLMRPPNGWKPFFSRVGSACEFSPLEEEGACLESGMMAVCGRGWKWGPLQCDHDGGGGRVCAGDISRRKWRW